MQQRCVDIISISPFQAIAHHACHQIKANKDVLLSLVVVDSTRLAMANVKTVKTTPDPNVLTVHQMCAVIISMSQLEVTVQHVCHQIKGSRDAL